MCTEREETGLDNKEAIRALIERALTIMTVKEKNSPPYYKSGAKELFDAFVFAHDAKLLPTDSLAASMKAQLSTIALRSAYDAVREGEIRSATTVVRLNERVDLSFALDTLQQIADRGGAELLVEVFGEVKRHRVFS